MTEQTARSQTFFKQHGNQNFAPLLSELEKRTLADNAVPFDIIAIRQSSTDKYGACWSLDIELGEETRGMLFSRGKPSDSSRDETFTAMQEAISEGPITAQLFVTTSKKTGNEFYYLDAPTQNEEEVPF